MNTVHWILCKLAISLHRPNQSLVIYQCEVHIVNTKCRPGGLVLINIVHIIINDKAEFDFIMPLGQSCGNITGHIGLRASDCESGDLG